MARPRKNTLPTVEDSGQLDAMNALALRIWEGQSPDLPLIERVKRIKAALIAKGYGEDLGALDLPAVGFEKYL